MPSFVNDLKTHMKNAKKALGQKDSDSVKHALRKCDAVVERIPQFADDALNQRVQSTRTVIQEIVKHSGSTVLADAPDVIGTIDALAESATAFTNENKWST